MNVKNIFLSLFLLAASTNLTSGLSYAEMPSSEELSKAQALSSVFEKVADITTPSVVNVSSIKKAKPRPSQQQLPSDPFFDRFRDFFGDDLFEQFRQAPETSPQQGLGTGVIVDTNGHILTNNHVIGDADEVEVRLNGEPKTYKATVVGTDPRSDLAVIKIKANIPLKAAKLGDSDKLKIGEWVIAAGNPFGLDNTITTGIVSAKGRSIMGGSSGPGQGQYEDFIQTDAAINPGNSGGPLVNLYGEVIGINTAIFSRSGGYMGIGFAIPSNMAKTVMESLISNGKVVRGWLGIIIQNLSDDLAQSFSHTSTEGALVSQVSEDSPAYKAGIKQGDIVVEFNGVKVKNVNHLRNMVAAISPGTSIDTVVLRNGKKESFSVKMGELPAQIAETKKPDEPQSIIGLNVENLTPELSRRLNTKRSKGVIVTGILPGSVADRAGIQPKDIIISVNGKDIDNYEDFKESVSDDALKKGIRLVVETQGMERFIFLKS
jgi:serine protease Do